MRALLRMSLVSLFAAALACACGPSEERLGECHVREGGHVYLRYPEHAPDTHLVNVKIEDADAKAFRVLAEVAAGDCDTGHLYGVDARRVFYRNRVIEHAHAESFEVLGDGYARDAGRIYHRTVPVPGADRATFQVVPTPRNVGFGKDADALYMREERVKAQVDAASFEVLGSPFFKDANTVYVGTRLEPVPGADPGSFRVLDVVSGASFSNWAADGRRGYYYSSSAVRPIDGIDPGTFEALNRKYARDSRRVYYEGRPVEGADPGSFHIPKPHAHHVGQDRLGRYVSGRRAE